LKSMLGKALLNIDKIMYKFFIEVYRRKENFEQLRLMGYFYKEISKIIRLEKNELYQKLIQLILKMYSN
ncbi:MAG: hypothetical protein ACLUDK_16485, partial [Clostridium paraputrificum]